MQITKLAHQTQIIENFEVKRLGVKYYVTLYRSPQGRLIDSLVSREDERSVESIVREYLTSEVEEKFPFRLDI